MPGSLLQSQIALTEIGGSEQERQKSLSALCWKTVVISDQLRERHRHSETQPTRGEAEMGGQGRGHIPEEEWRTCILEKGKASEEKGKHTRAVFKHLKGTRRASVSGRYSKPVNTV